MTSPGRHLLAAAQFDTLLAALRRRGYDVVGPRVRDKAIVYDTLSSAADLPIGWRDEHGGGSYRIERAATAPENRAFFNYVVGPHAWKKYLFPAQETLWRAQRTADGFSASDAVEPAAKRAFIGVRSCELHAIAIQDRVFIHGGHSDPHYAARRNAIFTVAVNCGTAGANCFCVSMNTGPRVSAHYDLVLTELLDADIANHGRHEFLLEAGSARGHEILAELPLAPATAVDRAQADAVMTATAAMMGRELDTQNIKNLLYDNAEHPRWQEVAQRCVSCGNCTAVCPTCFCSTVEDVTSLDGETAQRERYWASCFTQDFTHLAGGENTRHSTASRYRHWLTHKLAGWIDQFGTSGCVGCGRCITWCPPGIDLTEEVEAIRATATERMEKQA